MKKHGIYAVMALLLSLSMLLTACTTPTPSPDNGDNGDGGVTDEYVDYNPDKTPGDSQFDFPGNYAAPELKIDGKADDAQWAKAETVAVFGHGNAATVKIYRGEKALFFFVEVADAILATEGETNDDAVTRSDSVEIYIDTLADGGTKPQSDDYQINLGIHGKTRIMQGSGSGWGGWNGLIDYEVGLNGTLNDGFDANDTGYTVEVMIPYSQIGIEKDDTVAVSFGQVDKVGPGASATVDWDWYGWTYNSVIVEPQTPDNYLLLDKENNVMARDEEEKPDADMAGYVLDYVTGAPIVGATVTITSPEGTGIAPATTDEQGYFVFSKVDPDRSYTVTVEKTNYFSNTGEYTRAELRATNGGRVLKNITLRDETTVKKTTVSGTVKNLILGAVEGATVLVEGTTLSAVTGADGKFSITGVPAEDAITLTVTKAGMGDSKTEIAKDKLTPDGQSEVGDVNLSLPYGETGGFGLKSDKFADSSMRISRTLTGVELLFTGTRVLSGTIEVYLDVKECAAHRDQDATMWRFDLKDDGTVIVDNYAAEGAGSAMGLEYTLYKNDASGYSARLFIPYTYMGITPLEVFGISLGQWSTTANDWDGWGFNGQFIAPETPTAFVRVSATNELYRQDNNTSMVNLSGNSGMSGVRVEAGGISTVTGADGAWALKIAATGDAVSIVYSRQGYVAKTTVVPAGYFNTNYAFSENITLAKQAVKVSGTVTDNTTGAPIEGVSVTVVGTELSAVTDGAGKYTFDNIGTEADILIRYEKDGYASTEEGMTAAELSEQSDHTLDIKLTSNTQISYITLKGKITNVNGPVAGATVSVVGNSELSAVTADDGSFVLANYPAIDCVIRIEKAGYTVKELALKGSDVAQGAAEHDIGEQDLPLEFVRLHGIIADKSNAFAAFTGYVTRSATGFEFKFVGARAFEGQIELFVDTKTSAGVNARDTSDYLFLLKSDGSIQIVNWGEGAKNEQIPSDMKLTVENANTAPVATFTLPYSFFGQVNSEAGITSTEVIGISAGQWSTTANDWDGWNNFALFGANNSAFVKPEMPMDYIRIGAHNEIYNHISNDTLDLNEYEINFGTGYNAENNPVGARPVDIADNFYATVKERNENGVTFKFITTGDFGKNGENNEMVLVYFDRGESATGAWTPDYLIKVASDGTVYGKAGAWWSATESDKIGAVTITRAGGVTTFELTVSYETIGVAANEVFGVAMRECSHNTVDHQIYDSFWDCYFEKGTNIGAPTTGIDAANCEAYIRVAADGSLYLANSNS